MSQEELLEKVRQIREGRVLPMPTKKTAARKRTEKRKLNVKTLVGKMSPEERAKLLADMLKEK